MSPADGISESKRVLVVDDDNGILEHIGDRLRLENVPVRLTSAAAAFMNELTDFRPNLVFVDLSMPEGDGIDVLRGLREQHYIGDVILMSGEHERVLDAARRIAVAGGLRVAGVLPKPFSSTDLLAMVFPPGSEPSAEAGRQATALERRLGAYFRPKVDIKRGEIIGAHAYSPAEVAGGRDPSAPSPASGRRFLYDFRTIEKTASCCAALNATGRMLTFTVSLPAAVVLGNEFQPVISDVRQRYKLAPGQLIIELTDAETSPSFDELVEVLVKIRLAGIHLSVDSVGNGHESFRKLQRLPLSEFKIDRLQIAGLTQHSVELALVRSIVDLGHSLSCTVVAEGVDSVEALEALKSTGCDVVLGEVFSPPLNEAGFLGLLADNDPFRHFFEVQEDATPKVVRHT